ncbi:transcriptional regulator [Arcobacter sp. CECT 8989]|uniref:helix-turn-helix transcriptional regulator n=1 Tax=Arcobacter sp. CECT 8989 TaxID=2044509 RepID=UPI00100B2A8D|nr:helix-turn-helix transcriptional regulator [Arcobacter sp. CECT 8989]RXJ98682.1 transcriptional regulator [Arcobacter sp. CECT 8989]
MFDFTEDEIYEFHNKVSLKVRELRKEKNLSQLDLALELGLKNSSFISHAENPKISTHHFSIEHLYKISKILNIELSDILK